MIPGLASDTGARPPATRLYQTQEDIEETFVTYVITEACVDIKDKACIEECPVDCIYEGARMLFIHPD